MKSRIILMCFVILVSWGCAHPELTRRYHDKNFIETPTPNCVTVEAFTMDVPGGKEVILTSLSDRGQAALIKAIVQGHPVGEVMQAFKSTDSVSKDVIIDKTVFQKRVVFAVLKKPPGKGEGELTLADRINNLKVTLASDQKGVFESWNKFDTDYKTVDLGSISRSQKTSASLEADSGTAAQLGTLGPLKGTLTAEKNISETVPLRQQYIHIAGVISPDKDKADLYQEGAAGIDLTGTFSVDFKIQAPNATKLLDKVFLFHSPEREGEASEQSGKPTGKLGKKAEKSDQAQLNFAYIKYVDKVANDKHLPLDITCTLSYNYLLRHVVAHDEETAEGYHDVQFWWGSVPVKPQETKVTLVSANELKVTVFQIYKGKDPLNLMSSYDPELSQGILQFADYSMARDFLRWVKTNKKTIIAGYKLLYGAAWKELDPDKDIPDLTIKPHGLNYADPGDTMPVHTQ